MLTDLPRRRSENTYASEWIQESMRESPEVDLSEESVIAREFEAYLSSPVDAGISNLISWWGVSNVHLIRPSL